VPLTELSAAQAAFLDNGDEQKITPGAVGSRWRTAEGRQEKALRAKRISVSAHSTPAAYPVRALRTEDGGALVWYTVQRTATYTAAGRAARAKVPDDVRAYLGGRTGRTVVATWLWQTAAYVPVSGRAKVIIQSIDLASARAS
jgi:hypothetical protein